MNFAQTSTKTWLAVTFLIVALAVPAMSQTEVHSYTDFLAVVDSGGTPTLPTTPGGEAAPTRGGPGVTFYTDMMMFDAAAPGLPTEDFSGTLIPANNATGCTAGPLDENTNNNCFAPGGVMAGFSLQSTTPAEDLVVVTPPALGVVSIVVGPNTFTEDSEMTFAPGVTAVGMTVAGPIGVVNVNIELFGASGSLGTTMVAGDLDGTFWGATSDEPITRVEFIEPAGGGELFTDLKFGDVPMVDGREIPTLNWMGLLALFAAIGGAAVLFLRRS